jgi:hypothetical protein
MLTMQTPAAAAERCASPSEMTTLRVAALQQQLMVAALTCHQARAYNRFVLAYRPQLRRSDHAMLALFLHSDRADGDADYNAYKTRLANLAMLKENKNVRAFCGAARRDFRAAKARRSLALLAAEEQLAVRMPFEACSSEASIAPRRVRFTIVHRPAVEMRHAAKTRTRARSDGNWDDEAPAWLKNDSRATDD